ncbi:glycosyl transferase [Microbacterium sp. Root166]|uniref:glycosyltransferase n=1 Tax=Microbacterium sp. Root166 TaxID=1736478 RepID=UPI0006F8F5F4|nr:glycosyltransferase [Microbacterium sp. Root166]KQZ82088.1 glycosyl transferase [Microbacterium sp. Root166]
MPARVHAILVVRPDGRTPAAYHLRRTLAALSEQSRPVDVLTIVLCGGDEILSEVAGSSAAESVVTAPGSTGYAEALALITPRLDGDAVWLLAQDTAPEREALARLAGTLEVSPSVAYVAPKLVRWDDRSEIVSMGVGMTQLGRTVGLADGELDQGQHDGRDDVLGADVRGLVVRADAWRDLGGLDRALLGADEGLDLGVRARLAGARVTLVPSALVATAADGVAGLPSPLTAARRRRAAFASRVAQLHRRLVYAPAAAVPFHWLAILPLALWRTVLDLVRKEPGLILPEWGAAVVAMVRPVAVARSRRRLSAGRKASWSQLAPLRASRTELRERLGDQLDDDGGAGQHRRSDLRFFAGGGAWLVLAALVVSAVSFTALLAWPVLGGGALQPLSSTVGQLWADTAFGQRALGLDVVGPADPFAFVVALLGSLSFWDPSRGLVVLWILALPLAALGGWFAATRVTDRSLLRLCGGALWALAPTLLIALTQGRPAAVIAHLLLPWLFVAATVAHRSWAGAGATSLLLAAVIATAPSLAPALTVLWLASIVLALVLRAGRGLARLVWTVVPTLVIAGPLIWSAIRRGELWGLLADPGVPWAGPQVAPDAAGRALLAAGIPTSDLAGWMTILPDGPTWWVPLLVAPLALLALAAPLTQRWAVGVALLVVTALGVATAFAVVGIWVSFEQSLPVAIWPGAALSLGWLGAVCAALVTLDAGLAPRLALARGLAATVVLAAVALLAVPALTAMARGTSTVANGPESTLPAYVAAEGRDDPDVGTIVLTPQNASGISVRVVWGGSETLGGQTTLLSTRTESSADDSALAELAADLVTSSSEEIVAALGEQGVAFVLLAPASAPESDAARTMRLSASTALDQRDNLDAVGETTKGSLWRVTTDVSERPQPSSSVRTTAGLIAAVQLAVVAAALLLALPTAASRREARRTPRVVGPHWEEGR